MRTLSPIAMCVNIYTHAEQDDTHKGPSFWMITFSASLTNLTVLLPQSCDCSCYTSRQILAPPPLRLQKHN